MRSRRKSLFEPLEDRNLLACLAESFDLNAEIVNRVDAMPGLTADCFIQTDDSGGSVEGPEVPDAEFTTPAVQAIDLEPNDGFATAVPLTLGTLPSQDRAVDIIGSINSVEATGFPSDPIDFYTFDLRAGDVFSAAVINAGFPMTLYDSTGRELATVQGAANTANPPNVGLPQGSTSVTWVADHDGTYFFSVSSVSAVPLGYSLQLRAERTVLESETTETRQIVFLDFDGAVANTGVVGIPGVSSFEPLSFFLPFWGLTPADENAVINAIVNTVEENFDDLRTEMLNGDWPSSFIPGEYDIEIRNSRDHEDVWGLPNVSRMIIGGTTADIGGLPIFGIAQSIDVGNFDTAETGFTLLDGFAGILAPGNPFIDLNAVPLAPGGDIIDLIGEAVGNTTAHEIGHYTGLWHTLNDNFINNLMDTGGGPEPFRGIAGPDGLYGNEDDVNVNFENDFFDPLASGIDSGFQNTRGAAAFAMPTGTRSSVIRGTKFHDTNQNGRRDSGEPGLEGWTIFSDHNNDGVLDPREPVATSGPDGRYHLLVGPGTHHVREVLQETYTQTAPASGSYTVQIGIEQVKDGFNFGNREIPITLKGTKFNDIDGNGRQDEGEGGLAGVLIYLDLDNDNRPDIGEPATRSTASGSWTLVAPGPGTYAVREVVPAGSTQTFPTNAEQEHNVTVAAGETVEDLDFGNMPAGASGSDFGDAPAPYPTLAADGGASHPILTNFFLGAAIDGESDGIPSALGDGDDLDDTVDDEDGVEFVGDFFPGSSTDVEITVDQGTNLPGRVNLWIDFNQDGDWSDSGEHVVVDFEAVTGTHTFTVDVPADAVVGNTFARARYGYRRFSTGEAPTGGDIAGEVEDHQLRILGEQPEAMDDVFSVDQNSVENSLSVLDNDLTSINGPIFVNVVTQPNRGGIASIGPAGQSVIYTPVSGFSGIEEFQYTIQDQAGAISTATVTVTVIPSTPAIAVDDSFDVLENSDLNVLDVLANDVSGQNPPIMIVDVDNAPNGTVVIDRNGTPDDPRDDVLLYTPNNGFGGTDQFDYTIRDDSGVEDAGTVTVHVKPGSLVGDIVEYRLETANLDGTPVTAVGVGQEFILRAYVQDIRDDDGDGDPSVDRRGIGAAFLDVLYDVNFTAIRGSIRFGDEYDNATSGDTSVSGIIDEVGGLQTRLVPLGPDEVLLFEVPMIASDIGIANFVGDPADLRSENDPSTPEHDTLTFQPPEPVPLQGMRFTNTELRIVREVPVAIDDTVFVASVPSANTLDVLANDLDGDNPPIEVMSVTQGTEGGTVSIGGAGANVSYTPASGFVGVDSFDYTLINDQGLISTATVTVQVGNNQKSFGWRLETTDNTGNPISSVSRGSTFQLRAYIQDLRPDDGDMDGIDERGIFAAYTDLLYNSDLVSTIADPTNPLGFDVTFSDLYLNLRSGDAGTANLIDELGAFQDGSQPLGPDEFLLATISLTADGLGTADFQLDPADVLPLHDSLFFEPDTDAVPNSDKVFANTSILITGAAPEGELTNPANRYDVNADGFVSPIDPLGVINYLNNPEASDAEGEGFRMYVDVSGDGHVSPIDALQAINYLNDLFSGTGEGEGERFNLATAGNALTADLIEDRTENAIVVGPPQAANRTAAEATDEIELPEAITPRLVRDTRYASSQDHNDTFARWAGPDQSDSDEDVLSDELVADIIDHWEK